MYSRRSPQDLRASDADRELVVAMLSQAAGDGRITLAEHSERCEKALAAKTLGDLTQLTSDLALPSGQPIKLYSRRSVSAIFARERREGRWVVPESFPVTAFFGDVVLDLREAILQSRRVTIYATAVAGQIRIIVPAGVAVEMDGRSVLGIRSVRGRGMAAGRGAVPAGGRPAQASQSPAGVIQVRTLAFGGAVKAVTVRPSRWRPVSRRR